MKHIERAFTGNNFIPWYLVVILLTFLAQGVTGIITMSATYYLQTGSLNGIFLDLNGVLVLMDKNIFLLSLMIPFAISLLFMLLLIKCIHKRSFAEVVNGTKSVRWKRIFRGFLVWFIILGVGTVIEYILYPEDFVLQFQLQKFIPLLIISLIFIPLQTTFEEVLFRGYLVQGVGTLTGDRCMALIVPALIFTFMHMANPEVSTYGLIMFFNYLAMALIWGIICILDDGIEIGIGMHTANNLFISLFATQKGAAFETDAVFEVSQSDPYLSLAHLTIIGALTIFIFYKKYNWSLSTLTKKIEKPTDDTAAIS